MHIRFEEYVKRKEASLFSVLYYKRKNYNLQIRFAPRKWTEGIATIFKKQKVG
jgi:hypothetical protein